MPASYLIHLLVLAVVLAFIGFFALRLFVFRRRHPEFFVFLGASVELVSSVFSFIFAFRPHWLETNREGIVAIHGQWVDAINWTSVLGFGLLAYGFLASVVARYKATREESADSR